MRPRRIMFKEKKGACHGSLATYTNLRGYRGRTHPNRVGRGSAAQGACLHATTAPPLFSWTGCYLGGYVGGAWQGSNGAEFTDLGNTTRHSFSGGVSASNIVPSHSWSDDLGSSFIGGGTLGCNWQPVGSPFVLGLEGEFGYLKLSGEAFDPNTLAGTQTIS